MSALMQEMSAKALKLGIPLSVQLDLTYRCNERCIHCYLDHEDHGEMTTTEIKSLLDQFAEAGVFFLTLSGGEILLRKDFFEILEYARAIALLRQTQDECGPDSRAAGRPYPISQRELSADQHLLAPRGKFTRLSPKCRDRQSGLWKPFDSSRPMG